MVSESIESMLDVQKLSVVRDERCLFKNLSFSVRYGQLLYVRGRNGAGKTTLMRTLCGFIRPGAGEILWNGSAIQRDMIDFRRSLVYIGHENAIKGDLTVLENLVFYRTLHEVSSRTAAFDGLEQLGIARLAHVPCRFLSAGQKRRVALSRLHGSRAKLWLLDEPFAALDASGQQTVAGLIAEHLANGGLGVVTSHQDADWGQVNLQEFNLEDPQG